MFMVMCIAELIKFHVAIGMSRACMCLSDWFGMRVSAMDNMRPFKPVEDYGRWFGMRVSAMDNMRPFKPVEDYC